MTVDRSRMKAICEALIFVSEEALSFRKIHAVLEGVPAGELKKILAELVQDWKGRDGGLEIMEVAEGYQLRTRPENREWIKMLVQFKPTRLSKAALETLAITAYNQPATKPDIEAIRGVDCSSSLSQLLEKGIIKILGRKDGPGKPFIYGTTKKFLEVMGLKDLASLPTLREIEESEIIHLEGLEDIDIEPEPPSLEEELGTQSDEVQSPDDGSQDEDGPLEDSDPEDGENPPEKDEVLNEGEPSDDNPDQGGDAE